MSDPKQTTDDAVIGIEAIKALYVNGNARISNVLERLFNGEKAEIQRVAAHVGRAAREAINAKFATVRAEECERCAVIAENTNDSPPYDPGAMRHLIAQRIRECADEK